MADNESNQKPHVKTKLLQFTQIPKFKPKHSPKTKIRQNKKTPEIKINKLECTRKLKAYL